MYHVRGQSQLRDGATILLRYLPLLALAGSILLTTVTYGATRDDSLFLDDAIDLTRVEDRSYWQILWEPFPGFSYYRPVPYLLFKASYDITGEHQTEVLRTLLLLAHAASAWLMYMLIRRLTGSEWAVAAAALFILFPFSYQTIALIGAIGHALVTMFILTMLILWWEGRTRGSPPLLAVATFAGTVSVWTIEYGVIALPLLIVLEILAQYRLGRSAWPYPYLALLALAHLAYAARWFTMEKPGSEAMSLESVLRNGVLLLQAAAYPVTRFISILAPGSDPVSYWTVLLVAAVALAGGIAAYAIIGRVWVGFAALGVAFVCFLPSLLMLEHDYVLNGPRLLYVAAPAIAAFWALLGSASFPNPWVTWIWRGGVVALVAVTLVHSQSFVERRVALFGTADEVVDSVVEVANIAPDSEPVLLNVPSWFSFHSLSNQEYPLGHLGAQAIPTYLGLDGLYYAATGETAAIDSVSLAPDVSGWTYAFGPHGPPVDHAELDGRLRRGQDLYLFRLEGEGVDVVRPGRLQPEQAVDSDPLAVFGDQVELQEADMNDETGQVVVDLAWHLRSPLEGDYQIQVQALGREGSIVTEHRDYALSGMSPPRLWQAGDYVEEQVRLDHPGDSPVERVRVSLINSGDDSPMEVTDARIDVVDDGYIEFAGRETDGSVLGGVTSRDAGSRETGSR